MKKKIVSALLCMAMALMPATAFADGETIQIASSADLIKAIREQKAGQTWVLATGEYDVSDDCIDLQANINNHESGFVFPIFVDDLTIRGEGDVTITSTYDPNTGNWSGQNFITISGEGVTIENVKLQGNPNTFYGGQCNKVIELIDGGKSLTVKDVDLLPIEAEDGTQNSGSIYISVADAGETVIEDVTMSSWISASTATAGTIAVTNVTQDFTNNTYAGYSDATYGYAWNPGVSGTVVTAENLVIQVDNNANFVKQISDNLRPGTVVELTEDIEVDEMVYITTDDVTIRGNGHTITASEDFQMGTHGQINLFKIEADDVTVDNVKLVATADNKHTLDIYGADNVTLKDVTLDHENGSSGAPLINNASNVTVEGNFTLVTGENSWYGINVDDSNGDATVTFADSAAVTFEDNSEKDLTLVYIEVENMDPADVIKNPENAGLILGDNGQFVEHTHAYGEEWKTDEKNHWKECECGAKSEEAEHSFEWKVDKEATATEAGSKHEECTVCGYQKAAVEIPATGNEEVPSTGVQSVLWVALLALAGGALTVLTAKARRSSAR